MNMNINKYLSLIFFSGLFFLCLHLPISAQLVTNGSFEETNVGSVSADSIDGWLIQIASGLTTPPQIEIIDSLAFDGDKCLMLIVNSLGTNDWDIQVVADSIPVIPGQLYQYSIWARTNNPLSQTNFTVGNYAFNEYGAIRPATLGSEWQEFTLQFTITDQQTVIRAPIHFNISGNIGDTIFIDHLKISKIVDEVTASKPIIVEAESGIIGNDFAVLEDNSISYISIQTDGADYNPAIWYSPGFVSRTATFHVEFADTGEYNLFARVRVGPQTFDDDSFLYGNGFGEKDTITDSNWVLANGLASAGFSNPEQFVHQPGALADGVWKWINISQNSFGADGITFKVNEDSLSVIFQISGRETGLDIDKIAFGKSHLFYTVENLDKIQPGSEEMITVEVWPGPPYAQGKSKFLGSVYSNAQVQNFENYWNQVTPENAGKWGSAEPVRDQMNWGGLDEAYNFAKDNGFKFRFHVLIWGNQQPGWIESLSTEEQLAEIREWFEAVAERYPDIDYLEVVNEPLHDPPSGAGNGNYINALGGNGDSGWDWILNAFRMAREIFPVSTKLMINEYGLLSSSTNINRYLQIVELLKAENLIDGIGAQGHAFSTRVSQGVIVNNINSLASKSLPIQITEMDIDGPSDQIQLDDYKKIFPAMWDNPAVEGVTLWGFRPGLWRNAEGAYLLNEDGSERPAMEWLRNYVVNDVVSAEQKEQIIPTEFKLENNYPNPFNPTTSISFSIPEFAGVKLEVFDLLGRKIRTLVNEDKAPGIYTVEFNSKNLSSGTYIYRLSAGHISQVKHMILLK